ncbi:MAG: pitrilysin family protein [Candidatus Firestonebacteria bacterium]
MKTRNSVTAVLLCLAAASGLFAAPEKQLLQSGVPVVLNADQSSGIIAVSVFINAGSAFETEADNGISGLAFSMLTRGTKARNAEKFAEEAEALGIGLSASAGDDYSTISLICTKKNITQGLELLADALLNPIFPEEELAKVKQVTLARIKALEDDSFSFALKNYRNLLFKGDSYRFDSLGSSQNVSKIAAAQLASYHAEYFTAGNILISVSGDFNTKTMLGDLNSRLKTIRAGSRVVFPSSVYSGLSAEGKLKTEKNQSVVLVGFICPKVADRDYAALRVLNSALGGGMSSKLFRDLREKEGLAYSIGTFYPSRRKASGFTFYAGTRKENIEKVKQGMLEASVRSGSAGYFTREEFENARNYLIGQYRLDHQRNSKKAWYLGWYETTGTGFEYDLKVIEELKAVQPEDLAAAGKKYFVNPVVFVLESN